MKLTRSLFFWGIAGALCFAGSAIAQDDPLMQLVGVGNGFVPWGPAYVSPYQLLIGAGATTPTYAICDDFTTDISVGQIWGAVDNSLPSVGTGFFGGPQKFKLPDWSGYTIQQEYDAAALLAEDLMNPTNMGDPTLAGEYSYAIWSIFDPSAINYVPNSGSPSTGLQGVVYGLITGALSDAFGGKTPDVAVSIYTPVPNGASQEFLVVSTPEASLPATLGVELSALVGLVFLMRRRIVNAAAPR